MTTENTLTEAIEEAGLELRSGPLDIAIDRLKDAAARARKAEDRGADAPADDEVRAMLGSAEAVRSNAERIAALPDEVKLALFNAGLSARSTTVFRGNPFGHRRSQTTRRGRGDVTRNICSHGSACRPKTLATTSTGSSDTRTYARPTNGLARKDDDSASEREGQSHRRISSLVGSGIRANPRLSSHPRSPSDERRR
jgi:hypothetical protein